MRTREGVLAGRVPVAGVVVGFLARPSASFGLGIVRKVGRVYGAASGLKRAAMAGGVRFVYQCPALNRASA